MDEWLNTAQAAALLEVSEASVRRWGDRGVLPVRRVGRRGDRRFKMEDLTRFKDHAVRRTPGHAHAAHHVFLAGVPMEPFTHVATFYDSVESRLRVAAPFLESGVRAGEPCFLFAHGEVRQSYLDRLRRAPGFDLDAAIATGVLTVLDAPGTTALEAIAFWERTMWNAAERGPVAVHAVGDMAAERDRFESEAEMLAFEAALNSLTKRFRCYVVCQYDVRQFSGSALLAALRAHPDLYSMPLRVLIG